LDDLDLSAAVRRKTHDRNICRFSISLQMTIRLRYVSTSRYYCTANCEDNWSVNDRNDSNRRVDSSISVGLSPRDKTPLVTKPYTDFCGEVSQTYAMSPKERSSSPSLRPLSHLWRMASATPGFRLPSQLYR